jgi:hypothetical protein
MNKMIAEEFAKLFERPVVSTFDNLFGKPDSSGLNWGMKHVSKDPRAH